MPKIDRNFHYETDDVYDLDWSRKIVEKISEMFDNNDLITDYSIRSETVGYVLTYKVYYINFETENYDGYTLKLNDEYSDWILSQYENEIGFFDSGIGSSTNDEGEDVYTIDLNIIDFYDWIIEKVKENEQKADLTDKADNLIEELNESDDISKEDKVKIVKYLMKKLDVSIEDLE